MSVAEMKVKAAEKLFALTEEKNVKAIMELIDKTFDAEKQKVYNLSSHFDDLSNRYDETLKKLAK